MSEPDFVTGERPDITIAQVMLTEDQRRLLRMVGGWQMREALISPDGVTRLMQSMLGSNGRRIDGAPEWMLGGFQCGSGKVVAPEFGVPVVTVTVAQINRFAASLPDEVKAELIACREAQQSESRRTWKWCFCGREAECLRANEGDPLYGGRHHPTDAEIEAHYAEDWRVRDWQDDVLDRALGFTTADVETVGQLELFEVV